jgi:hypothetical protein
MARAKKGRLRKPPAFQKVAHSSTQGKSGLRNTGNDFTFGGGKGTGAFQRSAHTKKGGTRKCVQGANQSGSRIA